MRRICEKQIHIAINRRRVLNNKNHIWVIFGNWVEASFFVIMFTGSGVPIEGGLGTGKGSERMFSGGRASIDGKTGRGMVREIGVEARN